jgi:hypothetical protein
MASIYSQIAQNVQTIGTESCHVVETTQFAPRASVTIRNSGTGQTYNLTTTSTGEFAINNIQPGTYVVNSATVTVEGFTYDVFTDGVGGPDLGSSPSINVGNASTTYQTELDLRTDDSVSC